MTERHLSDLELMRLAKGSLSETKTRMAHIRRCRPCATALLGACRLVEQRINAEVTTAFGSKLETEKYPDSRDVRKPFERAYDRLDRLRVAARNITK